MSACPVCFTGTLTRHCQREDCAWRVCRLCDSLVDGLTGNVAEGANRQRKPQAPDRTEGD